MIITNSPVTPTLVGARGVSLLGGQGFGAFADDAYDILGVLVGREKLNRFVASLQNEIQTQAGIGAKKQVMPYLLTALALGALGTVFGLIALARK